MKAILFICTSFILLLASVVAYADSLPIPKGPVILTVSGEISNTNSRDVAEFDIEMLRNLDWVEIETHTSFTYGLQRFSGPTLASVLEAVGAHGTKISAIALNDYASELPIEHAADYEIILAQEQNGVAMRVRDRGPLWLIYPQTAEDAEIQRFDTEMVWQLSRLHISQ